MKHRAIGLLICGGILAHVAVTDAFAKTTTIKGNDQQAVAKAHKGGNSKGNARPAAEVKPQGGYFINKPEPVGLRKIPAGVGAPVVLGK